MAKQENTIVSSIWGEEMDKERLRIIAKLREKWDKQENERIEKLKNKGKKK